MLGRRTDPARHAGALPALAFAVIAFAATAGTLTLPSFWVDEAATISAASRPLSALWPMLRDVDAVHGLYYLLMHAWVGVFGTSEFALRLPSALCYSVTVALTVRLGQALELGRAACLTAGVALLVLPGLTWSGLEARGFCLAAALAVANMWAFVTILDHRSWGSTAAYAVTLPLMALAEIYTVLLLPVQLAWLVMKAPELRRRWLLAALPGAGVAASLALVLSHQVAQLTATQGLSERVASALWGAFFLGPRDGGSRVLWAYAASLLCASCVWVVVARFLVTRRDRLGLVLCAWALAPLACVLVASLFRPSLFSEHYFAFSVPGLALVLGRAGSVLFEGRRTRTVLLLLFAAALLPVQVIQRNQGAKAGDDFRALVRTIPAHDPQAVWFDAPSGRSVALAYPERFAGIRDLRLRDSPEASHSLWGSHHGVAESVQRLRQASVARLLVVYGRGGVARSAGAARARAIGCTSVGSMAGRRYGFEYFSCGGSALTAHG